MKIPTIEILFALVGVTFAIVLWTFWHALAPNAAMKSLYTLHLVSAPPPDGSPAVPSPTPQSPPSIPGIQQNSPSQTNKTTITNIVSGAQNDTGSLLLNAGKAIQVDGLTISNGGVTSFQGTSGDVTLTAGSGLSIDGVKFENSDRGSTQNIFKNIAVDGQNTIVADTNDDTLTFAAGQGITLLTDKDTGKLTITGTNSATATGFTNNGTNVYLSTSSDSVGIGTSSPASKFSVGSTSQFQVNSSGAIVAATGITASGGITFSGLSTGVVINTAGALSSEAQLAVSRGGTGLSSYTAGDLPYASASTTLSKLGIGSSGLALTSTGSAPTWSTIGATGITADSLDFSEFKDSMTLDAATTLANAGFNFAITGTGNVGIGTSPSYKLDVADSGTTAGIRGLNVSQTGVISGTGYAGYFSKTGASTTNVGLYATATGATNNYAAIFENGSVGIGTTAPLVPLHVVGSIYASGGGNGVLAAGFFQIAGRSQLQSSVDGTFTLLNAAANNFTRLNFGTANSSFPALTVNGSDLQVIRADGSTNANLLVTGNVGIGITSPAGRLDIGPTITAVASTTNYGLRIDPTLSGAINTAQTALYQNYNVPTVNLTGGTSNTLTTLYGNYTGLTNTAGTVSTWYGNYVAAPTGAGTTTNKYALVTEANAGNIGIGDATPASLLTVGSGDLFQINSSGAVVAATGITSSGTIAFSGLSTNGLVKTTGGTGTLAVATAGTDYQAPLTFTNGLTNSSNTVTLGGTLTQTTTLANAGFNFAITGTGNVGIGTSPSYKLDIADSGTTAGIRGLNVSQTGVISGTGYAGYFSKTGASTTNVGLYATATGATNNYAAIFEQGNVGVGTTAPAEILQIEKLNSGANSVAARLSNPGAGVGNAVSLDFQNFSTSGQGSRIQSYRANAGNFASDLVFYTNDGGSSTGISEKLRILSSGKVGIGTTAPSSLLHIAPSSTLSTPLFTTRGATTTTAGGIDLSPTISTSATAYGIYSEPIFSPSSAISSANSYLILSRAQNSTSNISTLRGLYVGSRTSVNYTGVLSSSQSIYIETPSFSGSTPTTHYGLYIDNQTGGGTNYALYSAGGKSYFAGNVGIGTSTPTTRLDLTGLTLNTDADQTIQAENITGSITKNDSNTRQFYGMKIKPTLNTGASNAATTFNVFDLDTINTSVTGLTTNLLSLAYGGTNRLTVQSGGNVGIGTSTPSTFKLEVGGAIGPTTDNTFDFGSAGKRWVNLYASNGTVQTSDARLKDNIQNIDYGLDTIMKLRPVSFNWKDKPNDGRKLGLIAQEVQPVVGEVVKEGSDPDKTLGIYYDDLIPVVIKSIQEQQYKINVLDAKMQDKGMTDTATIADKIDALTTQTGQMKNDLIQVHTALDSQKEEIASLSAKLAQGLADIETLKGSVLSASTSALLSSTLSTSTLSSLATSSAVLDDLTVTGKTNVNALGVTGSISAGLLTITGLDTSDATASASIETLSGPLHLQKNGLGPLELMADKIVIDEKGNLALQEGNIELKKGKLIGNDTIRGVVTLPAGQHKVTVKQAWDTPPVSVNANASYVSSIGIEDLTKDGFTANVNPAATSEAKIYWSAIW